MTFVLYSFIALIMILSFQSFDTIDRFRTQMANLNKQNFVYRNSRNALNLFMADLENVMATEGVNSYGLLTALKCKKKL